MNPLVSVIIPAYNKSVLTVKAVESVMRQSYAPVEIIVVDDGSTDNTGERISAMKGIRYIYKENRGACSARNLGLKYAMGSLIGFLDCDDAYDPQKIEAGVRYLQNHPEHGFVHTAAFFTGAKDEVISLYSHPKSRRFTGPVAPELICGNFICNSTVIVRRGALDDAGGFDESIFPPADWDLWLRLAERTGAGYIDRPLTRYRVTDNYTFNRLELSRREELYVIDKYFARHPDSAAALRRSAYSAFHLRYAQCYLLCDDMTKFQEELRRSLEFQPWNGKAWVCRAGACIARPWLKDQLSRKILRQTSDPSIRSTLKKKTSNYEITSCF